MTPELKADYAALLSDVSPIELAMAFERALQVCKFFPTPADIRAQVQKTADDELVLLAERSFESLKKFLREWGSEPVPLYRNGNRTDPPRFDAATGYAIRQCGGLGAIENALEGESDKAHFLKKNFIESMVYFIKTNGLNELPSISPVSILKTLKSHSETEPGNSLKTLPGNF